MSESRNPSAGSSRRTFLKAAAAVTAGTVLARPSLWAQGRRVSAAATSASHLAFPNIDPQFMITPEQALDWNVFKARAVRPTPAAPAGSASRTS